MSLIPFISNTPVWVWGLFMLLLFRGVKALSDREMPPGRLFFLPLLFLVWGTVTLTGELGHAKVGLAMMAAGMPAGVALGYLLWRTQPPVKRAGSPGLIIRPGTPLTLVLILLAFGLKYGLNAALYLHPELRNAPPFCLLYGLLTGLVDGLFWGGTLRVFIPWYRHRAG
ncbi:DUF6622 domain-containing protein [Kosakonia sp. BK9b]|uniref:DUF6622 family protein n=1 Tax=Kosakonia sp. TaxID=1916651 RepID=UPI00289F4DE9|nr:DUF6622 family protein [Kosakonia sp.]